MDQNLPYDLNKSQELFERCESKVRKHLEILTGIQFDNNIYTYPVEKQRTKRDKYLDCVAGIDYEFKDKKTDTVIATLAWRATNCRYILEPLDGVWNGFSLRRKRNNGTPEENCELSKRLKSIKNNGVYPEFTSQVEFDKIDNEDLLSLATARTTDIYEAYEKGYYRYCDPKHDKKEVWMEDVSWECMWYDGYNVPCWVRDATCLKTKKLDEYIKLPWKTA